MLYDERLSPELQASLDIITDSYRRQFEQFQRRQDQKQVAKLRDGRHDLIRLLKGLREDTARQSAPYEWACSEQIAEKIGRQPQPGCAFVPVSRDLTVTVASGFGYGVETEVMPGDLFAAYLHANSVLDRHGVQRVRLTGNAGVPRFSGNVVAGWQSTEGAVLTESQFAFAQAAGSPKSVGCYLECSDLFLKQTSAFAQMTIMQQLAKATAAEQDKQVLNGDGSAGKPTGILQTAGVGSVTGTSLAYGGVLDVIKYLEDRSAIVDPKKTGFVVAPDVAKLLRSRERATGSGMIMTANNLADYPAQVTKSIPDATLLFGDFSQLALLEWGTLEIGTDPYGADGGLFKTGRVGIRSFWTTDCIVLHADSFCKSTSIT